VSEILDNAPAEVSAKDTSTPADGPASVPQAPISAETFGISCSACGGSLRVHEGERSIRCEYCDCALLVTRPRGVRGYILDPRISEGKARLTALKHLSEETGGRIKARHASIIDLRMINVPFWRMSGMMSGWLSGDEVIRHDIEVPVPGPNGTRMVKRTEEERRPFSRLTFKRIDWSTPACSLRHLGLQGISLRTQMLRWNVFEHDMKEKLNIALPMKTAAQARCDGYNYMTTLAAPVGAFVKASRFELFGNRLSIYYYPVYILRYRHAGRIYSITIDGNNGSVIRGDVPRWRKLSARSFFLVPAFAAILAGTWWPLLIIAAGGMYSYDMVQSGAILPPHRWLQEKLERWFGGRL
jgi:DNA-directed RNA polymerase subunit RPC12/RpoP